MKNKVRNGLVSNSSNYTKDVVVFFDGLYKTEVSQDLSLIRDSIEIGFNELDRVQLHDLWSAIVRLYFFNVNSLSVPYILITRLNFDPVATNAQDLYNEIKDVKIFLNGSRN